MTVQTIYLTNGSSVYPGYFGEIQNSTFGIPNSELSNFGWTVGTSANPYWQSRVGASDLATDSSLTSFIDGATGPIAGTHATITTAGDSFSTLYSYAGVFAAGTWTFTFGLQSEVPTVEGAIRFRLWASVNRDGSSARELTSGSQVCSTVTIPTANTTYNSSFSWAAPQIQLNNEYLFLQIEWQESAAGTSSTSSVQFNIPGSAIVTTDYVESAIGPIAIVETSDTISGSGESGIVGSSELTENTLDFMNAGSFLSHQGIIQSTELKDILVCVGISSLMGSILAPHARPTGDIIHTAGYGNPIGQATVTEAPDVMNAHGLLAVMGTISSTDHVDRANIQGN